MAITLVTHAAAQAPLVASDAVTADIDTSGANLLIVGVVGNNSIATPSDNKSNSWTQIDTFSTGIFSAVYYVRDPIVGANHHFTESGTGLAVAIAVLAFAGINTAFTVEGHTASGNQDGTSPLAAGSFTPAVDHELICTFLMGNMGEVIAVDSGCTLTDHLPFIGGQAYAIASAYLVQGTAAAINPSWSYTPVSIEHAYNDGFKPSSTTTFLLIPGR